MNNHVASARYGVRADGTTIGRFDKDNQVHFAVMNATNMSYVESHLTLLEAYNLTFGLHTEEELNHPMSIMEMRPHEDYITDGATMVLMDRILRAKLPTSTGMSLVELMELPGPYLEHLLTIGQKAVDSENETAQKFMSELDGKE